MPVPALVPRSWGGLQGNVLPPGIHTVTLQEIEAAFATTPHRQRLWAYALLWVEHVTATSKPDAIVFFGSYFTDKLEPNDIDAIVILSETELGIAKTRGIAYKLETFTAQKILAFRTEQKRVAALASEATTYVRQDLLLVDRIQPMVGKIDAHIQISAIGYSAGIAATAQREWQDDLPILGSRKGILEVKL